MWPSLVLNYTQGTKEYLNKKCIHFALSVSPEIGVIV